MDGYLVWSTLFAVMYTLYTSVSKFLPPTSYMKAIEWWLLFHILVPLMIFVVLFLQASAVMYCHLFTSVLFAGAHSKAYGAPRSSVVPHRRLRPPLCSFWRNYLAFRNIVLRHCLCFDNVDALLWSNVQPLTRLETFRWQITPAICFKSGRCAKMSACKSQIIFNFCLNFKECAKLVPANSK